jgi:predicted transcriptional regulator
MDMKKITAQQALDAFHKLGTQVRAAEFLGVSQATVSHCLLRAGFRVGRGNNQPRHDEAKILQLWEEHGNQHTVGKILGIRQSAVGKVLRRKGIHVGRGNRKPNPPLPIDEIAKRYLNGETCRQLGKAFGVQSELIRRRLRRAKVSRRVGGAKAEKNYQWKGGKKGTMHEFRRQAYEVAAICLGRPLPRAWVIHHLDEDPTNNDPSNLVLFRSQRLHCAYHQQLLRLQIAGQPGGAIQLALESGAVALPPPPVPIVFSQDKDPHDLYESLRKTVNHQTA